MKRGVFEVKLTSERKKRSNGIVAMATERWSVAGFGDDLLNSSNITYSNMSMGNNSNDSNITTPAESVYRSYSGKEIIFFLCCTIGVGGEAS